jgi:hypothetical protein
MMEAGNPLLCAERRRSAVRKRKGRTGKRSWAEKKKKRKGGEISRGGKKRKERRDHGPVGNAQHR